jgi:two-component system alkaline phosphatase synthesis response regulator PhoP
MIASSARSAEPLRIANLEILPREYQLLADGKRVGLTVREFQTFLVLAQRPDRVVTRPEIYSLVWGGQMAYRDRSVDVFVRKVRRKLAACAPNWAYLHTHFGVGYRFSPERVTSV